MMLCKHCGHWKESHMHDVGELRKVEGKCVKHLGNFDDEEYIQCPCKGWEVQ